MKCDSPIEVCSTRPRKFKLEFYDSDGVKHSIAVDGPVTREKIGKILDLVEVLSGSPQSTAAAMAFSPRKFDRLASTLVGQMKGEEFTSTEAKKAYETSFGEKIPLSTVSTYLSRLVDRGVLERGREQPTLHYKVTTEERPPLQSIRPPASPLP